MSIYLDGSAIVKLIREEPESAAIAAFARTHELATSELAVSEVPRAIHQRTGPVRAAERDRLLTETERVLADLDLVELNRDVLVLAGSFEEPRLRTLDAIHLATALQMVADLECFVSYDRRQADVARTTGFPVAQPGR